MNPEDIPLRDLHLPAAIRWWPPAPGWWLLLALLLAALAWCGWRAYLGWRRNAPRRVAMAELARLESAWQSDGDVAALGRRLSPLLRRAMLAYSPRAEVAGLTGHAWLEWLDRGLDGQPFSAGPGRHLEDLPYRRPLPDALDIDAPRLIQTVRRRLATPLRDVA